MNGIKRKKNIRLSVKEKICGYIDSRRDEIISDLKRLVDIKSVREASVVGKPFGAGPARVLKEACDISASHGFDMLNMENYVGEITFGSSPVLMLLAHLDVVDEGDFWTMEPYNMKTVDGKAYGRGTTDDKGAAVACIYALKTVSELFGKPKSGVRLVLGCSEETGSEDMKYYFSKRERLPFTLSPDADYPVINLEKGKFTPSFYKKTGNAGEKTVIEFKGGKTANIVPCRASAVIKGLSAAEVRTFANVAGKNTGVSFKVHEEGGHTVIDALGESAHAAQPEKGNNAQTALLLLLKMLPLDNNETMRSFEALYALFPHSDTRGKAAGVSMSDETSGDLTLNFGVLSFEDGRLSGTLDLRLPLCANESNVKTIIVKELETAGFHFDGEPEITPVHYVPEDAPIIKTVLDVYEEYTGRHGECLSIGGGTYVHSIEGGVAFGVEFPGADYRIHGADEFAIIDELLLTAKMYAAVIYDLCY